MAETATKAKVRRNRKPSAFSPTVRITVSRHADISGNGTLTTTSLGTELEDYFKEAGLSTKLVSRSRKPRKAGSAPSGIANLMVYVAPSNHQWAATAAERGVRLDAETAKLLRGVAETMGLDPNDPASIIAVAKALAQKASSK